MKRAHQTSESIELAVVLAISGGLMDAYSYMARGKVFANAQTGNMLLLGVNLADGNFGESLHYLVPVLAFAAGIAFSRAVKHGLKERRLHWRQVPLLVEFGLLAAVAFVPAGLDLLADSMISLACGMQVEAFRKLHGKGFATTMCIGNLRSGTQHLVDYVQSGKREELEAALLYLGVILCFVLGAVIGVRMIRVFGLQAILASSALLAVAFLLLFQDREAERA